MSTVTETIEVDVPVRVVYNQWTQFEEFPEFMGGIERVDQLDDTHLHWVASIAGVTREWNAEITEQIPDTRISWTSTDGAANNGAVSFVATGPDTTEVTLDLDFDPEGIVEQVGDKLGLVQSQARTDLKAFREFITARGTATGGWRQGVPGGMVQ